MSRNLDTSLQANLSAGLVVPVVFVQITFKSETSYVWSGSGTYIWNGQSYLGVGSLGKISAVVEGTEVKSDGVTLELSGIDTTLQSECLTDIQIGAPAKVWYGHLNTDDATLVGTPYLLFSGLVDKPSFSIGNEDITIRLALENKMINLSRPNMRRYTSADQRLYYSDDTAFGWVEQLSDQALIWG